jgi:hypothetical protein
MKTKFLTMLAALSVFVLTLALVSATDPQGVGNPDFECQQHGFDLAVEKYQCPSTVPDATGMSAIQ